MIQFFCGCKEVLEDPRCSVLLLSMDLSASTKIYRVRRTNFAVLSAFYLFITCMFVARFALIDSLFSSMCALGVLHNCIVTSVFNNRCDHQYLIYFFSFVFYSSLWVHDIWSEQ